MSNCGSVREGSKEKCHTLMSRCKVCKGADVFFDVLNKLAFNLSHFEHRYTSFVGILFSGDVLTCLWLEPDLTKPDCSVHPDFKLTDNVSRTVTIHIPAANQSHVGRYFCDIVPTREDVTLLYCQVDVKGQFCGHSLFI